MIRRWSRVNQFNIDTLDYKSFHFKYFYLKLRKSIIYKKFYFKYTKFRRRLMTKIKFRNNWILYTQILKYWIDEIKMIKLFIKFQLMHKIAPLNFVTHHFNFLRMKKSKLLNNNFHYFNSFLTKHFFVYYNLNLISKNNVFLNYHSIYNFEINAFLENKTDIIPVFLNPENQYYAIEKNMQTNNFLYDFSISTIFQLLEIIYLKQIKEIYKILNLLYYFLIFKS